MRVMEFHGTWWAQIPDAQMSYCYLLTDTDRLTTEFGQWLDQHATSDMKPRLLDGQSFVRLGSEDEVLAYKLRWDNGD